MPVGSCSALVLFLVSEAPFDLRTACVILRDKSEAISGGEGPLECSDMKGSA